MTLLEKIREQHKSGIKMDDIIRNMLKDGYSMEEISAERENLNKELSVAFNKKHPILTNKFFPLVMIVLNYLLFFHIIPISVANDFYILFSIVGGVLMLVFTLWASVTLMPNLLEKFPIAVGITSILTIFVFGYFFIVRTSNYTSNQLTENGVKTHAVVVDKTRIYGKRGRTINSISVQFITAKKEKVETSIDISSTKFEEFQKGMNIIVIYSSENPKIAEIDYRQTFQDY